MVCCGRPSPTWAKDFDVRWASRPGTHCSAGCPGPQLIDAGFSGTDFWSFFYTDRIFYQADTFFISQTLFRFWRQLWVSEILSARHFFCQADTSFYQADTFPFLVLDCIFIRQTFFHFQPVRLPCSTPLLLLFPFAFRITHVCSLEQFPA